MNCTACPYQKQIDALRKRCLACNPESDGGTPHGRVKADEFTLNSVPRAIDFDRTPSGQATNLAPDLEHKWRMHQASQWGLDPMELLLAQCLMNGGSLESFGGEMQKLARRINRYHGSPRAMAWAIKSRLLKKIPAFAECLKTSRENDSATRILKELHRG